MHPPRRAQMLMASLAAVGCARAPATAPPATAPPATAPPPAPFLQKASIGEIMAAQIDPAADALWASVAITLTAAGEEDRQPRTAEEWAAVRRSAITLIEATDRLVTQGRLIAPANAAANRAPFLGFARSLRDAGLKALAAIDAKDAPRLLEAGGEIDQACEACHRVYWYPPSPKGD